MQQTEKYQFNLIDSSDDFSPGPLNDNAVKLETAMEDYKAEVRQALCSRVRAVCGSYVGTGEYGKNAPCSLALEDGPILIVVLAMDGGNSAFITPGQEIFYSKGTGATGNLITWEPGRMLWYNSQNESYQFNSLNYKYAYVIFY